MPVVGAVTDEAARASARLWGCVAATILLALAVWRWLGFGSADGGDFAQYLLHAQALASGQPYGDIGYLYSPQAWSVGPPLQPIGLPLTLAPLLSVFGAASEAPRLLMYASLAGLLWFGARCFRGVGDPGTPALTALVAGAALLLLGASAR